MAFDPAPGAKYGLRAFQGDTLILDGDEWSQALVADIESMMAGYVAGTHTARLAATALEGQLWRETDTGAWFAGTGTGWVQIGGPRTTYHARTFTMDDATQPNSAASEIGSFPIYPGPGETVGLVAAILFCKTVGSTPSVFKLRTDHAAHGTMADVTGLTALQPATTQQAFTPTGGTMTLASLDRVAVQIVTAGNSLEPTVSVITSHTV